MEIKTDCFAYDNKHKECTALNCLFCEKEECNFYKSNKDMSKSYIEFCVRNYSSTSKN